MVLLISTYSRVSRLSNRSMAGTQGVLAMALPGTFKQANNTHDSTQPLRKVLSKPLKEILAPESSKSKATREWFEATGQDLDFDADSSPSAGFDEVGEQPWAIPRRARVRTVDPTKRTESSPEQIWADRLQALQRSLDRERVLKFREQKNGKRRFKPVPLRPTWSRTRAKLVRVGHPVKSNANKKTIRPAENGMQAVDESDVSESPEAGVQLEFAAGEFSTLWNLNYSRLQRRYDRKRSLRERRQPILTEPALVIHPHARDWAHIILQTEGQRVNRAAILEIYPAYSWRQIWFHSVLWILKTEIDNGIRFLQITHQRPFPATSFVSDALLLLAMHYSQYPPSDVDVWQRLRQTFMTVMERPQASPLHFEGSHIRLLLPHCSPEQIVELRRAAKVHSVQCHGYTLLHFSTALSDTEYYSEALDCLLEAPQRGVRLSTNAYLSVCATILRRSVKQPDGLRLSIRIISNLVKLGVAVNVQLCNIIMLNAVEAGDVDTAYATYRELKLHGIQADKYTYAILLKAAKANKNFDTLSQLINEAISEIKIDESPVVATEMLHCLFLHHYRHSKLSRVQANSAYGELFDSKPLVRLGLLKPQDIISDRKHPAPTPAALGLMIAAHLLSAYNITNRHMAWYLKLRQLAADGDELFQRLLETDHIFNVFLKTFNRSPGTMKFAADIMRDMQSAPHAHPKQAQATAQSWSIFMHGFVKHGKMDVAEQVLQYMQEKGIEPTEVTWKTLLHGYVGIDPGMAFDTLKRMEDEGFTADDIVASKMAPAVKYMRSRLWRRRYGKVHA